MLLLTETPGQTTDLNAVYERQAREGFVHSGLMCGERFDIAEGFKEEWATPAITWSAGGEERYRLQRGEIFHVRSAGALVLAAGERYAYTASSEAAFRSNMITFPQWMTREARQNAISPEIETPHDLKTRLFSPPPQTQALMNEIAAHCMTGVSDNKWYTEQIALLYARLIEGQNEETAAANRIGASKETTRAELARRVDRALRFMLEQFDDPSLDLKTIAREACLSPYHLIRVFKALTGETPMRRLTSIRMEAGLRLLRQTRKSTTEVAAAVGYSDRTAFFKAFKGRFSVSPSQVERTARCSA